MSIGIPLTADWDVANTPVVTRDYCPVCDPARDPLAELVTAVLCSEHRPTASGTADEIAAARNQPVYYADPEAGGESNRRWCELFHRPKERK
jgi:hypothetical protein